jgi:hypothetical protein
VGVEKGIKTKNTIGENGVLLLMVFCYYLTLRSLLSFCTQRRKPACPVGRAAKKNAKINKGLRTSVIMWTYAEMIFFNI